MYHNYFLQLWCTVPISIIYLTKLFNLPSYQGNKFIFKICPNLLSQNKMDVPPTGHEYYDIIVLWLSHGIQNVIYTLYSKTKYSKENFFIQFIGYIVYHKNVGFPSGEHFYGSHHIFFKMKKIGVLTTKYKNARGRTVKKEKKPIYIISYD